MSINREVPQLLIDSALVRMTHALQLQTDKASQASFALMVGIDLIKLLTKEQSMSSPGPAEQAAFATLPHGRPLLRAKMRVERVSINKNPDGTMGSENVRLVAVYGGSDENKAFAKYTPSASFDITIDNPAAQGYLSQGHEYYVDFTPAA